MFLQGGFGQPFTLVFCELSQSIIIRLIVPQDHSIASTRLSQKDQMWEDSRENRQITFMVDVHNLAQKFIENVTTPNKQLSVT